MNFIIIKYNKISLLAFQSSQFPFQLIQFNLKMSSQIQVSNIDSKKVFELRKIAKELKICQWYNMNKAELITNIKHKISNSQSNSQSSKPKICVIELIKCCGLSIKDDILEKCENISDKKYCPDHSHIYRLEKPDDCPICMESISDETEIPLECGHLIHKECLIPTNIHICPMCRQSMKQNEIDYIFGNNHQQYNHYNQNSFIPNEFVEVEFVNEDIMQNIFGRSISYDDMSMYNNQEHYFQDHPNEYPNDDYFDIFQPRQPEEIEYSNDFEQPNEIEYSNDFEPQNNDDSYNPFDNMSVNHVEMIIQEIEIRPNHNSYFSINSDISFVPQRLVPLFYNYIDRIVYQYLSENNSEYIHLYEMISLRLFSSEETVRLMKICYNIMRTTNGEIFELLFRLERFISIKIDEVTESYVL